MPIRRPQGQTRIKLSYCGFLPFLSGLVDKENIVEEVKSAAKIEKIDNGIEAQKKVMSIPAAK